ncbi:DUF4179 domain-containing protein [Solibacillus sp. FSL H8-0538]|uniref:DUF4179 domain-containing protein n=1 Tax=Solibacillus sp. FSL H8-0538 TaxID=2921400 RepID=UPI0030F84792
MSDYKKWANVNFDDIELAEVSAHEKKRVKQHILGKKKATKRLRKWGLAAAILLGATITTGFAFPSIASQIPFVQNIMSYFNEDFPVNSTYDDFATTIDTVQTSKEATMVIEKAVYDGNSITISYALQTDLDLGESPMNSNYIKVEGASGTSGVGKLKKIKDNTYVGIEKITPFFDKKAPKIVNISWKLDRFESTESSTILSGDWKFSFSLTKLAGATQLVNEVVEKEGVTVHIQEIERNDMTTVIRYEQLNAPAVLTKWAYASISFTAVDDLGNTYELQNNGGTGDSEGLTMSWSDTMSAIDQQATTITLQPIIYFSTGENGVAKIVAMDAVEIELE